MGGATAEISSGTTAVLLEVANFNPQAVAATGKRLGLLSEARTRFERGVDPEVAGRAISRFVELLGPRPGAARRPTSEQLCRSGSKYSSAPRGSTWCSGLRSAQMNRPSC